MTSVSIPLITLTRILLSSRNNPVQSFDRKGFIFSLIYFHDGGKSFKVDDKKKRKEKAHIYIDESGQDLRPPLCESISSE